MKNKLVVFIVVTMLLGGCIFLPPEGTPSNGYFTSWEPDDWSITPEGSFCMVSTMHFVNKQLGLGSGHTLSPITSLSELPKTDSACIWRTEDGGHHWQFISIKAESVEKLIEKDLIIYAASIQNRKLKRHGIWESHDLGLTWRLKTELESPYGIRELYFRDTLRGLVMTDQFYSTSDGGKTWQPETWMNHISVREITDSLVYGVVYSRIFGVEHKVVGCWNYVTRREVFRTEMPHDAMEGHFSNGILAFVHDKRLKVYQLGKDNRYHLLKECDYKADWVNYLCHENGHIYLLYNLNFDNKLIYSSDGGRTWQRRRTWSSIVDYCTYYEPDTLHFWYSCHKDMGHFKN